MKKQAKKVIAVSVGDLNGIGIEIALRAHDEISKIANPIYCISEKMLDEACELLGMKKPNNMQLFPVKGNFTIKPSKITKKSGLYSYRSFLKGIKLCETKLADALVTLPIHKEAWSKADLPYKGHTDMLRDYFDQEAIMMLGCDELYVALYTEHIPLKDVVSKIKKKPLSEFLISLAQETASRKIAVLGLNPHAGDGGVLGNEEEIITKAITKANDFFDKKIFYGPMVPDTAFTPHMREEFQYYAAMYHDQGLTPLKALYFDQSINVSLCLPIIRTSVDHGTAFDIAYQDKKPSIASYINAVKTALFQIDTPDTF